MRDARYAFIAVSLVVACDHSHGLGSYEGEGGVQPDAAAQAAKGDAGEGGSPETAGPPMVSLALGARHLAFARGTNRLFATIGGGVAAKAGGALANSVAVFDGAPAHAPTSVSVGAQPSALGVSDDGTTLWVGLDGAATVRKVDLTADPPAPGKSFSLPTGSDLVVAQSIWVLQGSASTIAISLRYPGLSPNFAGVAIYDDGVAREVMTPGHTGAATLVRGQAGWLFGVDTQTTGFEFYSLPVTATGVTQVERGVLIPGFETDLVYADGRVYASTGPVVDVSTPTDPTRAGAFAFSGAIAPVPAKKRAYMLSPSAAVATGASPRLRVLDTERFIEVSGVDVPGLTQEDAVWDLIQTSDNQVVFLAGDRNPSGDGGRVIFLTVDPLP